MSLLLMFASAQKKKLILACGFYIAHNCFSWFRVLFEKLCMQNAFVSNSVITSWRNKKFILHQGKFCKESCYEPQKFFYLLYFQFILRQLSYAYQIFFQLWTGII